MMIAHASIPADDRQHVARVLAEILQGEATPFPPGGPGSWMAWSRDGQIEIEVFARGGDMVPTDAGATVLPPRPGERRGSEAHLAVAVERPACEIVAIARREGWRTGEYERGDFFGVVEVWVENAFLLEFLDPAQLARYRASMTPENWKRAFGVEATA